MVIMCNDEDKKQNHMCISDIIPLKKAISIYQYPLNQSTFPLPDLCSSTPIPPPPFLRSPHHLLPSLAYTYPQEP